MKRDLKASNMDRRLAHARLLHKLTPNDEQTQPAAPLPAKPKLQAAPSRNGVLKPA